MDTYITNIHTSSTDGVSGSAGGSVHLGDWESFVGIESVLDVQ